MNTDQEQNKLGVRKIHPWAQHGDAGQNLRAGIIQVPEDLRSRLRKSQEKTTDEVEDQAFQDWNEIIREFSGFATVIENFSVQKSSEKESQIQLSTSAKDCIDDCIGAAEVIDNFSVQNTPEKEVPNKLFTSLTDCVDDCIATAVVIDQINPVSVLTKMNIAKPLLPDEDIMNSISCLPLILPPEKQKKSQEPRIMGSKKSSKSDSGITAISKEKSSSGDVQEASSGFEKVKSKEKSLDQISKTGKDLKKSAFLSWLKEKNKHVENGGDKTVDKEADEQQKTSEQEKAEEKRLKKEKKKRKKEKKKAKKAKKKAKKERKKKEKARKKKLEKLLKSSTEIGDEIASETLAKLLAHQGHTKRAIEMYEKLILLFPKKSSYFAEIIENLEEK
ncbi:MAG: hypothetical protein GVX78_00085 [Bacteroidetes bacterium]|nr:hypothetical protein [Bacteroidota bacterium]